MWRTERGFTLLEVLIALAVLAIALAAGSKAVLASIDTTIAMRDRTVALWVAENRLAELTVAGALPGVGEAEGNETQGTTAYTWHQTVSETPNYSFRRVAIRVTRTGDSEALANLVGYISNVSR